MAEPVTPQERGRLSGPGLRTFAAICAEWGLTEAERAQILDASPDAYRGWVRQAHEHADLVLDTPLLSRISVILNVYLALQNLYPASDDAIAWLHGPHRSPPFNGQTPISLITTAAPTV
jgi:hypothetical protein